MTRPGLLAALHAIMIASWAGAASAQPAGEPTAPPPPSAAPPAETAPPSPDAAPAAPTTPPPAPQPPAAEPTAAPQAPITPPPAAPPRAAAAPERPTAEPAAPSSATAATAPVETPPETPLQASRRSLLHRFEGSYIDWQHDADPHLFGGSSYSGSEDFSYSMYWYFTPSLFLYRSETHQLRLLASLPISFEVLTSNTTTGARSAEVEDPSLAVSHTISLASWGGRNTAPPGPAAAFNPTLDGGGEYNTWVAAGGALVFPASRVSQAEGRVLATSLSATLRQRIKLLGSQSPGLPHATAAFTESWRHDFFHAITPTSPVSNGTVGTTFAPDQISSHVFIDNRLRHHFNLLLPLYRTVELSTSFGVAQYFKPALSGSSCITTATGPVCPSGTDSSPRQLTYTEFDLSLAWRIIPEVVLDVGYERDDPTTRYVPVAETLYADLAFFPERLLDRLLSPAGPPAP
jgi:hypothetical protein